MAVTPRINNNPLGPLGFSVEAGAQLDVLLECTGVDANPGDHFTVTIKDNGGNIHQPTWDQTQKTLGQKVGGKCHARFVSNAGIANPGDYVLEYQKIGGPPTTVNLKVTPAVQPAPQQPPPAPPPVQQPPPAAAQQPPTVVQQPTNNKGITGMFWGFALVAVTVVLVGVGIAVFSLVMMDSALEHGAQQQAIERQNRVELTVPGLEQLLEGEGSAIQTGDFDFRIEASGKCNNCRIGPQGASSGSTTGSSSATSPPAATGSAP